MDGAEEFRTCRKGHTYRGDENYAARHGWCPVCNRERQARYAATPRAKENARLRAARYRERNREKVLVAGRAYANDPENKERARLRRQTPEGREKSRLAAARYRAKPENREKRKLYAASYWARYASTPKGRATIRRNRQSEIHVSGMYLGKCGFTEAEIKAMLDG